MNCQAHETILAWGEHCFELVKIGDTIFAKENKHAILLRIGRVSVAIRWFHVVQLYRVIWLSYRGIHFR